MAAAAVVTVGATAHAGRIPLERSLTDCGYRRLFTRDGISVYRHRKSKLIRIAAEGTFDVPPARVRKALLSYSRHRGTIARVSESRVLSRGMSYLLVYQRLDLPVISDRDFTLLVRWGSDDGVLWTSFRTLNSRGPAPQRGAVRMKTHRGSWQLKPIRGGRGTRARYMVTMDLGGWMPSWMARSGTSKEIPGLFRAITGLIGR